MTRISDKGSSEYILKWSRGRASPMIHDSGGDYQ